MSYRLPLILMMMVTLYGCATGSQQIKNETVAPAVQSADKVETVNIERPDKSKDLANIRQEDIEASAEKKGVIFAKTDFQGVLQKSYVKLIFETIEEPVEKYQLFVGDVDASSKFPWEVNAVQPGYFYIELPEGSYRLSSLSIPVGSTQATEETNLMFDVTASQVTYLGTLKVIGTKEKIKLGGVPVIKPGFEYTIEIHDEKDEAVEMFHKQYPQVTTEIRTNLMTSK